jgi:hypothetical protein
MLNGQGEGPSEGSPEAVNRTGASPMKTLIDFLVSLIAIKSNGEAGAVLLREH